MSPQPPEQPELQSKDVALMDQSYSAVESQEGPKSSVTLEWQNLSYVVTDKVTKQSKTLLNKMNGKAIPGSLLGIMGTSGAGKSTLLDCLAGRVADGKTLSGALKVNGQAMDKESFKRISGFVMQSDALFPLLTVRETIRYAAALRCVGKTHAERDAIADSVLSLLKLDKCADTIVGDDLNRGVSGGERRRVTIAVDLVNSPAVLFLDEPTSGLDSSTAFSVVESLKELAMNRGCTIVMTIHQPSARLFALLDSVIFLSNGCTTYSGPVASLKGYTDGIYATAGLGAPPSGNLPEIMLDLCDALIADNRLELVTAKYASPESAHSGDSDQVITELALPVYANSFLEESAILTSRAFKNVLRTPELFFARMGASVGFGVMLGTLFLNTQDNVLGLQHRLSYFVFCCAFYYYTSLEALPIFLAEREIFQREYSRGAYRAGSYTLAQSVTFFPAYAAVSVLFTCITWWLVGLPQIAGVFFFQILTVFTIMCAGNAFATLISTIVPSPMVGQTAGSALLSVMFLFSGFFIKSKDIPDYWIWLHYTSLFKYAFDSLIVNDLTGVTVVEGGVTIMDHDAVLDFFSVKGIDRGRGIWVLWLFIIGFRAIFMYRLRTAFSGVRK